MWESRIEETLKDCRAKVRSLLEEGRVNKSTARMLLDRVGDLQKEVESIHRIDPGSQEFFQKTIARDVVEWEETIAQISEYDSARWNDFGELFREVFMRISEVKKDVDFYVVVSTCDREPTALGCKYAEDSDGGCFILYANASYDFGQKDLLPLVSHEVVHLCPEVSSLVQSLHSERAKKGEALADFLSLNVMGPAYANAFTTLILDIMDPALFRKPSKRHPSLSCRANILRFANRGLWEMVVIEDWTTRHFERLDELGFHIPPTENTLSAKCIREAYASRESFARFKISEDELQNIARGHPPERNRGAIMELNVHAWAQVNINGTNENIV